jgi:hypothetical protein
MPNIKISDEMRGDLIVTALEGGSNYWYNISTRADRIIDKYKKDNLCFSEYFWEAIKAGESIPIHDIETNQKLGEINLQSIEVGEQTMADEYPRHLADIVSGNWDAETADVWFQLAVMNELVYG